jgi:hypothetical protein
VVPCINPYLGDGSKVGQTVGSPLGLPQKAPNVPPSALINSALLLQLASLCTHPSSHCPHLAWHARQELVVPFVRAARRRRRPCRRFGRWVPRWPACKHTVSAMALCGRRGPGLASAHLRVGVGVGRRVGESVGSAVGLQATLLCWPSCTWVEWGWKVSDADRGHLSDGAVVGEADGSGVGGTVGPADGLAEGLQPNVGRGPAPSHAGEHRQGPRAWLGG